VAWLGGAYETTAFWVSSEKIVISLFESTLINLSAQNWRYLADAFRGNEKTAETLRCPNT
jgi:hypothetical protein